MRSTDGPHKRRSQIILDDDLYRSLATEADLEGRSISALVREAVSRWLDSRRPRSVQQSPFWSLVGTGRSGQTGDAPISENTDRYLYPAPGQKPGESS